MITDRGLELLMLRQYRTRSRFRPHPQEGVESPDRPQIRLHGARSERAGRLRALMMLLLREYIEQHPCAVPIVIMLFRRDADSRWPPLSLCSGLSSTRHKCRRACELDN